MQKLTRVALALSTVAGLLVALAPSAAASPPVVLNTVQVTTEPLPAAAEVHVWMKVQAVRAMLKDAFPSAAGSGAEAHLERALAELDAAESILRERAQALATHDPAILREKALKARACAMDAMMCAQDALPAMPTRLPDAARPFDCYTTMTTDNPMSGLCVPPADPVGERAEELARIAAKRAAQQVDRLHACVETTMDGVIVDCTAKPKPMSFFRSFFRR